MIAQKKRASLCSFQRAQVTQNCCQFLHNKYKNTAFYATLLLVFCGGIKTYELNNECMDWKQLLSFF